MKRNDATGHVRGQGHYSKSHPKLASPPARDAKIAREPKVNRMSGPGYARKVSDRDRDGY